HLLLQGGAFLETVPALHGLDGLRLKVGEILPLRLPRLLEVAKRATNKVLEVWPLRRIVRPNLEVASSFGEGLPCHGDHELPRRSNVQQLFAQLVGITNLNFSIDDLK